jgi:hypothetical protein
MQMTSNEPFPARDAVEKSVEMWKQSAQMLTEQAGLLSQVPQVDLAPAVERYFEFVQRAVDANRDFALKWATSVNSLSGVVREQAESVGHIVVDQAERAAELVTEQAEQAEKAAREQAKQVEKAAREQAKQAQEKARERYDGLTKAELSDALAERDLPKSGNVDELIERLVDADSR